MRPTEGLSAGPLLLAVTALAAALASIAFGARSAHEPDRRGGAVGVEIAAHDRTRPGAPHYERVQGPLRTLAPAGDPSGNDVGSSSALCPAGSRAVSGGYQTVTGGGETFYSDALTDGRIGWAVGAVNDLPTSGTVQAYAYCVSSGRTGATRNQRTLRRQRASARRKVKALVAKYRALRESQL